MEGVGAAGGLDDGRAGVAEKLGQRRRDPLVILDKQHLHGADARKPSAEPSRFWPTRRSPAEVRASPAPDATPRGLTHEEVDQQRDQPAAGHVEEEPVLVADVLKPECDVFGGTAEDRNGERIGQADAERPDAGGEELRLHHGIDRRVARHDDQAQHHQAERGKCGVGPRHRGEQRDSAQRRADPECDEQRSAADAIRQRTE